MKKLLSGFVAIILAISCMQTGIHAQEDNEELDYQEEIAMFQDFYEHPDQYIFQDADGNDVTAYVLEYEDAFHQEPYAITDHLMDTVRSVQEEAYVDTSTSQAVARASTTKSKTWSNLKVYYEKNKYCIYSVTGTYTVTNGKITSGKATPKVVNSNLQSYTVKYIGKTISSTGKTITYTIEHKINLTTIKTKHSITIS